MSGGKQRILCWQISRCQKGFPNNFYPPVASNTISKQHAEEEKHQTSLQAHINILAIIQMPLRAFLKFSTSGYVGAGSPDLDLAIAVEMSQVGAFSQLLTKMCQSVELAGDSSQSGWGLCKNIPLAAQNANFMEI